VSYAWGDDSPEGVEREAVVDQLCDAAAARGIRIVRDKDVLGLGARISAFMQEIGTGDRIFVILSDKYLRSPYCMYELSEIWRTSKQDRDEFCRRVWGYVVDGVQVRSPKDWIAWRDYWKKEYDELDALGGRPSVEVSTRLTRMHSIYTQVVDILGALFDTVQPRTFEELRRCGFDGPASGQCRRQALRAVV
jgi:internalin A